MSAKQSNEKLIETLQATEKGTPTAKAILSELWERNERLIETFIYRFTGLKKKDIDFEDMKQQSYFAFYTAAYTFDLSKGYAFSTYLYFYIQKESSQAYYNGGSNVRIPRNMRLRIKKMRQLKGEAETKGQKVTYEEILKKMGLSEESTKLTLSAMEKSKTVSLYKPLKNGEVEETNISDTIASDFDLESDTIEQVWLTELREYLFKSLKGLSQIRQNIIIQHFFADTPLSQIGVEMGVSRQRTYEQLHLGLSNIRHGKYSKILLEFLPLHGIERAKRTLKRESEIMTNGTKNNFARLKRAENTKEETTAAFNKLKIDDFSRGLLVIESNKSNIAKTENTEAEITTVFNLLEIDDFSRGLLAV